MDKFKKSNAGKAWTTFKKTGKIEDAIKFLEEMREHDKMLEAENKSLDQEIDI